MIFTEDYNLLTRDMLERGVVPLLFHRKNQFTTCTVSVEGAFKLDLTKIKITIFTGYTNGKDCYIDNKVRRGEC